MCRTFMARDEVGDILALYIDCILYFCLLLQLLAPFAYKCPRFFQLHYADKKQPGYINMSLEYKVKFH